MMRLFAASVITCSLTGSAIELEGRHDDEDDDYSKDDERRSKKKSPPLLEDGNFEKELRKISDKSKAVLVKFDKTGCQKCKEMQKVWKDIWQENASKVYMANVDCSSPEGKPLCERLDINRYPTYLAFTNAERFHTCSEKDGSTKEKLKYWAEGGYRASQSKSIEDQRKHNDLARREKVPEDR